MKIARWFTRLRTPSKLFLLLSLALLPIGAALVWTTTGAIREAKLSVQRDAEQEARSAAREIESLIARNALALRLAANAALGNELPGDPCPSVSRTLAIAPGVIQRFQLEDGDGQMLCAVGDLGETSPPVRTAPGDIRLWVADSGGALLIRVGVAKGSATSVLPIGDIRGVLGAHPFATATIGDGQRQLAILADPGDAGREADSQIHHQRLSIANDRLSFDVTQRVVAVSLVDQLTILLPLLMWALAVLISWLMFNQLLIRPLRRLQRAVSDYAPGDDPQSVIPQSPGTATEIGELGEAFVRAVQRIDEGERKMGVALEGQRRLVREVHHRVKNNLQVVASLLSIHGRSVEGAEGKAAYSAIGRRVDALSVVHRNHFAELEENQGIQLRPMLNELASGLRASAPEEARGSALDLDLDPAATTQDVAIAAAFLITEVVEFAMLAEGPAPVEISLRRTSALTARLMVASPALLDNESGGAAREQFERIVAGLARQLRSPLERQLGRYSVDLPIFPER
jgi:two-component sensor histidine kinase